MFILALVLLLAGCGQSDIPITQRWRLISIESNSIQATTTSRFNLYLGNTEHFIIKLDDGTKWEIAQKYRAIIQNWGPDDTLEISQSSWWPLDQFRIRNLSQLDHWENPQEIWGYTFGGLEKLRSFYSGPELKIVSFNRDLKSATLSNGQVIILKDLPPDRKDSYYLLAGIDPNWPYALLSLSVQREYTIVEARPQSKN